MHKGGTYTPVHDALQCLDDITIQTHYARGLPPKNWRSRSRSPCGLVIRVANEPGLAAPEVRVVGDEAAVATPSAARVQRFTWIAVEYGVVDEAGPAAEEIRIRGNEAGIHARGEAGEQSYGRVTLRSRASVRRCCAAHQIGIGGDNAFIASLLYSDIQGFWRMRQMQRRRSPQRKEAMSFHEAF